MILQIEREIFCERVLNCFHDSTVEYVATQGVMNSLKHF